MTLYTDEWRAEFRESMQASAAALVPVLVERFAPSTVIDVGCGEGWFVKEFHRADIDAIGVDGFVDGVPHVDLASPPYPDLGPFDMAMCLEVAEHVHAAYADDLVEWLVSLSKLVVFSAAVPGQGGVGHVNEQPHDYWIGKFAAHGYHVSTDVRDQVADDDRISWWYRNNILAFSA